jgi:hypothetical protein
MLHLSDLNTEMDSDPEPVPSKLPAIRQDVRAFLYRYIVLTAQQAIALTLWVAHTHTIDAFDTTPYLQITSATKRAGKTRLLETMEPLVARAWLTGRTSSAALVRKVDADKPTLLLDESDATFRGDQEFAETLRGLLNSGYKRSGKATFCVGKGAEINVRDFSTFGCKAIAGIGQLPDTVADRAIPIVLRRRMTSEPVQRWRERDGRAEAAPIHRQLTGWSRTATDVLRAARPDLPSKLSDRAADVWEPLLAIADMAGGDWPARARAAAVALMGSMEDSDPRIELLTDLVEIVNADGPAVLPTKEIIEHLVSLEHRPWATWKREKPITARGLAKLLEPLDVHPARTEALRGYRRDAFTEVIARYLPDQASLRQNPNNGGLNPADGTVLDAPPKTAIVSQSESESIGLLTECRLEAGDDSDERF